MLRKAFRKLIKVHVENYLSTLIGKVFWTPVSVAVLAENSGRYVAIDTGFHHELPGGVLKIGEDLREAAKREFHEETGLEPDLGDLLDVRTHRNGITFFFEASVEEGEFSSSWEGRPVFVEEKEMGEKAWRLEHAHVEDYLFPESS